MPTSLVDRTLPSISRYTEPHSGPATMYQVPGIQRGENYGPPPCGLQDKEIEANEKLLLSECKEDTGILERVNEVNRKDIKYPSL